MGHKSLDEGLPWISIIIPTLNEEENIAKCLASTYSASNAERIVVDGGSRDRTVEIALACRAKVLTSPAGRARQMNAGAESAAGEFLVFLHADTLLPEGFANTVRSAMALPDIVAGAFEFRLDMTSPGLRFIERMANWRSRRLQLPYGDQAIFTRSALFRRLQKKGRIHTAPHPAITSARRWRRLGLWKTTLINELVVGAYYLGVSPSCIHRCARRNR